MPWPENPQGVPPAVRPARRRRVLAFASLFGLLLGGASNAGLLPQGVEQALQVVVAALQPLAPSVSN